MMVTVAQDRSELREQGWKILLWLSLWGAVLSPLTVLDHRTVQRIIFSVSV